MTGRDWLRFTRFEGNHLYLTYTRGWDCRVRRLYHGIEGAPSLTCLVPVTQVRDEASGRHSLARPGMGESSKVPFRTAFLIKPKPYSHDDIEAQLSDSDDREGHLSHEEGIEHTDIDNSTPCHYSTVASVLFF